MGDQPGSDASRANSSAFALVSEGTPANQRQLRVIAPVATIRSLPHRKRLHASPHVREGKQAVSETGIAGRFSQRGG